MFFILLLLLVVIGIAGLAARAHFGSGRSRQTGNRSASTVPVSSVRTGWEVGPRTSGVGQGEGWWLASDGNWYPPQGHPNDKEGPPSQPPVLETRSHSSAEPSTDQPAVAHPTARQCVNGHEMPESHIFCSVCGSGKRDQPSDFSAPHSDTRTGLSQKIREFYSGEGKLTPAIRIILTALIVVFVIGGIGMAAAGGSSPSGSSSNNSSGGGSSSAPAQSPTEVCYSTLEGWAIYFMSTNDGQTIDEDFGISSGIPMMIFTAASNTVVAATQNGRTAGQMSLASATVANCKTLIGEGDDPTTWPTAPSS